MDNLWYIIGGLVALIAGAGFFMHRKAQAEMAAFDELDDELYEDNNFGDFENSEVESEEEQLELEDELDLEAEEAQVDLDEQEPVVPTESETGDAVGEADIYIAYGKFDQAEEMLQRAIIADPANVPARLKLLEVYSETKDVEKFDVEYAQLMDLNDSSANKEAEELRSRIPDAGEFSIGAAAVAATTAAGAFAGDLTDKLDFGEDTSDQLGEAADSAISLGDDLASDLSDSADGAIDGLDLDSPSGQATDFGEISLDFDNEESLSEESASEESLALDSQELSDSLSEEGSDFELDLDLDDLDDAVPSEDIVAEAEAESSGDDLGGIDFELDLDSDAQESVTSNEEAEIDAGLTLDLDDSSDDADTALTDDDDFLSDLEFSAGSQSSEEATATDSTSSGENATLDDAFDLDMEDMDLAALDEEMDALVGDLDELDETELASSPAAPANQLVDEVLESETIPDDLNLSESATDLDDMISLDEPSLDELSVEGDLSDLSESLSDPETASADSLSYEEGGDVDDELDSELDFLADTDEVATKLDLARAYIDMGDKDGAKDILEEVVSEGNDEQKVEAQELIGRI